MFKVNVAPDMGMYNLLRSQGYDPAYALAEFVDNALQAHMQTRPKSSKTKWEPLKVDIRFYTPAYATDTKLAQSIVIEDNGPGIQKIALKNAMKPARPSATTGLSEFGIGMKASAVWFSDTWSLTTSPVGDSTEYLLDFKLKELLNSSKAEVSVKEEQPKTQWQGTRITLSHSRRIVDRAKFDIICKQLTDIYQRFTSGSSPHLLLTAHLDDSPTSLAFDPNSISAVLVAPMYKISGKEIISIGKSKSWTVSVDTTFLGKRVTGEISILEHGSYKDNPGLVMFRYDRVIRGTRIRPYQPAELFKSSNKYASQRVYGNLFVDGLPVTYTKDGFDFEDSAFCAQLRTQPDLEDLFAQAEAFRSDKPPTQHFKSLKEYEASLAPKRPAAKASVQSRPSTKTDTEKPSSDSKNPEESPKPAAGTQKSGQSAKQSAPDPFVVVMEKLQNSGKASAALLTIIGEILALYRSRRLIAVAMCLRVVLESGMLAKIERDHPTVYGMVSDKGVAAVIKWVAGNSSTFFDSKRDHKIIKCLHSIVAGTQADVVLLNNAAHGHYQLSLDELTRFVNNLEQLLIWSYS